MGESLRNIYRAGLRGLLRPVIHFCIARSFRIQDLEELAKSLFLELSEAELQKRGREANLSNLSAMTGLHRRDVKRLWRDKRELKQDTDFVTRVVGQWQADKRFTSAAGAPRVLSFKRRQGEFAELVASVSTDLNPYTVLFELERAGIAESGKKGVKLLKPAYRPVGNLKESMRLLSSDASDLVRAVDQNIFDDPAEPNLHMSTTYDNIPASKALIIRRWFMKKGQEFHAEARNFLAALDRDITPGARRGSGEPPLRAVVGTFGFTEETLPTSAEKLS